MLPILLGSLGYSLLNISQAIQKIGLSLSQRKRFQGMVVWLSATLGTLASSIVVFAAVALGNASLVGAMAGTGLAALAVFSHFILKERVNFIQISGIAIIVLSAGLIGFFSKDNPPSLFHIDILFILLSSIVFLATFLWFIFRKKTAWAGTIIGILSGSLGGFVPLFQKISTSDFGKSLSLFPVSSGSGDPSLLTLLPMISNPFTGIWIVLSILSMIVLQFAYKKTEVIKIIPFFTASSIIIPVIGGVLGLEEQLHPIQWIGVVLILGGLFLLTIGGRRTRPVAGIGRDDSSPKSDK
jgi:drug/metabolite transporter (DMT)-like permease